MNRNLITLLIALLALLVLGFAGSASAHHATRDGMVPVHPECATADGACPVSDASEDTVECGELEEGAGCDADGIEGTEGIELAEPEDAVQG